MIIHNFNDSRFPQLNNNQYIAGINVPKGYVNATEMVKFNPKKKLNDYLRSKSTKAYLEALSGSTGIPVGILIIVNESKGKNNERGTWVHYEIAIDIAQWISPDFRVWANRVLRLV